MFYMKDKENKVIRYIICISYLKLVVFFSWIMNPIVEFLKNSEPIDWMGLDVFNEEDDLSFNFCFCFIWLENVHPTCACLLPLHLHIYIYNRSWNLRNSQN